MTAVIWNSSDATANIVLTGGSLIATASSASNLNYQGVRATASQNSGKYYYEWVVNFTTSGSYNIGCGWANATANIGGGGTELGHDTNGFGVFVYPTGWQIWLNGAAVGGFINQGVVNSDTIQVAFDITNLLLWVRINRTYWNFSSTADPGTGVGGKNMAALAAGPYFPVFNTSVTNGSAKANFGALAFDYALPTGFSRVDTETQNYNASAKLLGYAEETPPLTGVSGSKLLGYADLPAPLNAVNSSKLLGYIILDTVVATGFNQGYIYG